MPQWKKYTHFLGLTLFSAESFLTPEPWGLPLTINTWGIPYPNYQMKKKFIVHLSIKKTFMCLTESILFCGWSISNCFLRETRALLSSGFSARSIALWVGVMTSLLSTFPLLASVPPEADCLDPSIYVEVKLFDTNLFKIILPVISVYLWTHHQHMQAQVSQT